MEQLKNHSGKNSLLVLRPGDAAETSVAWKLAMENKSTPTALILSRQNITDLPATTGNRYQDALQSAKGGYIVKETTGTPDIIFVANGSEVATLVAAAQILEQEHKINARVVSVPSSGLFLNLPVAERVAILPAGIPRFGLTVGLPSTLLSVVGSEATIFGLDHFGYSAPAELLDEKFGFTPSNVVAETLKQLGA